MLAYADAHGIDHATFDKRIRENLFWFFGNESGAVKLK
jgi:hypothetical protein